MEKFEKLKLALRYSLQGAASTNSAYLAPLKAFEFASGLHLGKRKDGTTPEFMHQLEVTLYARTLSSSLLHPAETLAALLLHDSAEDYGITYDELQDRFGRRVAHAVRRMSKIFEGGKLTLEEYFANMLDCPIATFGKGCDRVNNQQSMLGVFRLEKQQEYIEESTRFILPMLKKARRLYPEQEMAYENVKMTLLNQIQMLRAVHAASALPVPA